MFFQYENAKKSLFNYTYAYKNNCLENFLGGTMEVVGGDVTIRVDTSSQPTSLPARLFEVIPPQ